MKLRFNIDEIIETEFFYGVYAVHILGGHYLEVNSGFNIKIINVETNEEIVLDEVFFKGRDYKFRRKSIKYFTFQILKYGKFRIFVCNYDDMILKDSILITQRKFSPIGWALDKIQKPKDINNIEILIE